MKISQFHKIGIFAQTAKLKCREIRNFAWTAKLSLTCCRN